MNKICFLIPTTSNNRNWVNFNETYLNNIFFKNFPKNKNYKIFMGYNFDDPLYNKKENRPDNIKGANIEWISFNDDYKGNPCAIWTELCKCAISEGYEYFMVLGDDILLPEQEYWVELFINQLKENNNIGYSAGYSNNNNIPTQFLLHKKHMDIFGWIFPPQITNYFCDDFLYELYGEKYGNWNKDINLLNLGGEPRYTPKNDRNLCTILVRRHRKDLYKYVNKFKYLD